MSAVLALTFTIVSIKQNWHVKREDFHGWFQNWRIPAALATMAGPFMAYTIYTTSTFGKGRVSFAWLAVVNLQLSIPT